MTQPALRLTSPQQRTLGTCHLCGSAPAVRRYTWTRHPRTGATLSPMVSANTCRACVEDLTPRRVFEAVQQKARQE